MILAVLAGTLSFPVAGLADTAPDTAASIEEAAVIAAEDDWIRAELDRDEATLRRVIDDQFVSNSNNGQTAGKEDLIKGVLGWNMTGQTISERSVLVSGDTSVIFGTTELRFASAGGEETKSLLRYTSTYVKRDGQWRATRCTWPGAQRLRRARRSAGTYAGNF